MKTPSNKQINFANEIAKTLNINFPQGDYDFTAQAYYLFISTHIKEYNEINNNYIPILEDENDVFWGYDYGLWEY